MSVCVVTLDAAACGGSIKYIGPFVWLRMTALMRCASLRMTAHHVL